ncbi:hypothetical protein [Yersinia rohdei]|uniref:hypothetical protein n=1 Tax=Yersinia rohdei TaxID=29485 RepID=UPI001C984D08|nr:hypothetical protein [Yersinia rohdei]
MDAPLLRFTCPLLIITDVVELGIVFGDQLLASNQSSETEPFHVSAKADELKLTNNSDSVMLFNFNVLNVSIIFNVRSKNIFK